MAPCASTAVTVATAPSGAGGTAGVPLRVPSAWTVSQSGRSAAAKVTGRAAPRRSPATRAVNGRPARARRVVSSGTRNRGAGASATRARSRCGVASSSEPSTVRPGAGSIRATEGTARTWQPAASAEATPVGVSSTATQAAGGTRRARQAAR